MPSIRNQHVVNDLNLISFHLKILALHDPVQTNQEIKKGNPTTINGKGEHTVFSVSGSQSLLLL